MPRADPSPPKMPKVSPRQTWNLGLLQVCAQSRKGCLSLQKRAPRRLSCRRQPTRRPADHPIRPMMHSRRPSLHHHLLRLHHHHHRLPRLLLHPHPPVHPHLPRQSLHSTQGYPPEPVHYPAWRVSSPVSSSSRRARPSPRHRPTRHHPLPCPRPMPPVPLSPPSRLSSTVPTTRARTWP